jgi:O-antigen ligase
MTALLVIAAVAGLVWGTVYLIRGSLPVGCLAVLFVGSCLGYDFFRFDTGPVTMTFDRLALVGLVAAYAAQRWMGRTEPKPASRWDFALLALVGLLTVSTFMHDWRWSPVRGMMPAYWRLIGGYLIPLVLYWVARQSAWTPQQLGWVFAGLVLFGVYLAVTGIAEFTGQWAFVFPSYIADPGVGAHFGRARGPYLDSIAYGWFLNVALALTCVWRPAIGSRFELVRFALIPLFLAGIVLSLTRCVWVGAAAGLLVYLALVVPRAWRTAALGGILLVGVVSLSLFWSQFMAFKRDFSAENTRESAELRPKLFYVTWQMFLDRPLLGCGFGQFVNEKLPYLADKSTSLSLDSIRQYPHHNVFLCLLTENGLVGLVLFVIVLVGWVRSGWMLWKSPAASQGARRYALGFLVILGAWLPHALFHELSHTSMANALLFFLAGTAAGLQPETARAKAARPMEDWQREPRPFETVGA